MRTQFETRALVRVTVAGSPPLAVVHPLGARRCEGLEGVLARIAPRTMSSTALTRKRRRTGCWRPARRRDPR
eukprot:3514960-Pleurochrysis_carterae.AAC.1